MSSHIGKAFKSFLFFTVKRAYLTWPKLGRCFQHLPSMSVRSFPCFGFVGLFAKDFPNKDVTGFNPKKSTFCQSSIRLLFLSFPTRQESLRVKAWRPDGSKQRKRASTKKTHRRRYQGQQITDPTNLLPISSLEIARASLAKKRLASGIEQLHDEILEPKQI